MSECNHDCSSCGSKCAQATPESLLAQANPGSHVKRVIAVVSGKGGVGKSLVTGLMACMLRKRGHKTAVLDADITGPSIPKSFGITQHAFGTDEYLLPVCTPSGLQVMSINLILEDETAPVVWRGPVIAGAVTQFWTDVLWQDVDYMFVDMPPGTGDVTLTVFQSLPLDGIVVVSSPQELVELIVEKAVKMADMMNIPVLGLVENMSYMECPHCGEKLYPFGESKRLELAAKYNIEATAALPIKGEIAEAVDGGNVEAVEAGEWLKPIIDKIKEI